MGRKGHGRNGKKGVSTAQRQVDEAVREVLNLAIREYQAANLQNVETLCVQVLQAFPDNAEALNLLGAANLQKARYDDARTFFTRAIAAAPDNADMHNNLGIVLAKLGEQDQALDSFHRALELNPDFVSAHGNIGNVYKDIGRMDEALFHYRKALALDPGFVQARNSLLFSLYHVSGMSPQQLFDEHREYDRVLAAPITAPPLPKPLDANKKPLTVGLLGNERLFRSHPVMLLTLPGLEAMDPDQVRFRVYTDGQVAQPDRYSERLQRIAPGWRDISGLNDAAVAGQIRADGVDVLIFTSGHTECRLLIAAHRAAPVQVLWGGHWGTSGLSAMDWIIADRFHVAEGEEALFSENVYRMPDGCYIYQPPDMAPDVNALPALENGFVTFGCLNRSVKVTPPTVALWARAMTAVPKSRLLLKDKHFAHPERVAELTEQFAQGGVTADRLIFEGGASHAEFLKTYNKVDFSLDTLPYSGGITTCEALWMGAPVLSLAGDTFPGRHTVSHLANVGLESWIADSADDFVEKAVHWAGHLDDLAKIRTGLRAQMSTSPLCDGPRFARNLHDALRAFWKAACA